MGGDLGGDVDAAGLRPADHLDRPGGRHVADVQPAADVLCEQHVARDDRLLGDGRPAGEAEFARERALVHLGALGEARLLRVLGDHAVERLDVLECAAHEQRVGHAESVVAEDPHVRARSCHGPEFGELGALQADRDRADRLHRGVARRVAEARLLLDDARGVGDGKGVRHREDGGEPAGGRGPGAGEHGLALLVARLAQVRVQVDEAGQRDEPVGIEHRRAGGIGDAADLGDDAALEQDVGALARRQRRTGDEMAFAHQASPRSPDNSR